MAIADKLNEKEMEILKVNTTFAEMILNRKKIFVELYFWVTIWFIINEKKMGRNQGKQEATESGQTWD